ncbi:hypothetical protein L218DRAFT_1080578 [Marasmius fiardii PR-910]|nr:hypothetical protein L218DRAFT_1080578 [Marasmius fiardii PR-910]
MRVVPLAFFAITLRYVGALNIIFPSTPTAAQNNPYNWVREVNDPNTVWLRKQKLDDLVGATPWSGGSGGPGDPPEEMPKLDLTRGTGSGVLHFNRAGLFNVGVFSKPDYPVQNGKIVAPPIQIMLFTVSVNPTSAGAVQSSTTSSPEAIPTSTKPSVPDKAQGSLKSANTALIVGLTLGFATLIVIIAVTLFYFRYRRRRMADAMPIPFQGNRMMREADRESYLSYEKCDSPPPIQTIYSVPSDGSFSVTSPIAAAARDRERKRNKFLSLTTISSLSISRSTTTVTRNGHLTDRTEMPLPPLPPRTRTDRQMMIEEKIQLLQSKMIMLQSQKQSGLGLQRSPFGSIRPLPPLPPGSPGFTSFLMTPKPLSPLSGDVQVELEGLKKTVERMKELHESDWALGLTNVTPEGLPD